MRILRCLLFLLFLILPEVSISQTAQQTVSAELNPYLGAVTLMDYSIPEVLKAYPELKGMGFAQSQEELVPLLLKVGEAVQTLFADLPKTSSVERISQERTEPNRTEQLYGQQDFYYLISPQNNIADVGFEEYRTTIKEARIGKEARFSTEEQGGYFMLTSGYATHPIYFHPKQQSASRYRYLGRQRSEGKAHVIAFAQRPESDGIRRYLRTHNQDIVILLQGLAWIDPDNFQIIRMRSDLLASRKEAGLEYQTTAIRFGEVKFKDAARSFWMPQEVSVTVKYQGYIFRNRHRYSQYRLFTVEAQDGPIVPIKPKDP